MIMQKRTIGMLFLLAGIAAYGIVDSYKTYEFNSRVKETKFNQITYINNFGHECNEAEVIYNDNKKIPVTVCSTPFAFNEDGILKSAIYMKSAKNGELYTFDDMYPVLKELNENKNPVYDLISEKEYNDYIKSMKCPLDRMIKK